jgi:hypothetical protein
VGASPLGLKTGPDRAPVRHRDRGQGQDRVRDLIERSWLVHVYTDPEQNGVGTIVATSSSGATWTAPVLLREARSPTETVLHGYVQAFVHLAARRAGEVLLVVQDATLLGYLERGWSVGRPWILRRLADLLGAAERADVWWGFRLPGRALRVAPSQAWERGRPAW